MNKETIFYGPHQCHECGAWIVKAARDQGGDEYDWPFEGPYPNTEWVSHVHRLSERPVPAERRPSNAS